MKIGSFDLTSKHERNKKGNPMFEVSKLKNSKSKT